MTSRIPYEIRCTQTSKVLLANGTARLVEKYFKDHQVEEVWHQAEEGTIVIYVRPIEVTTCA